MSYNETSEKDKRHNGIMLLLLFFISFLMIASLLIDVNAVTIIFTVLGTISFIVSLGFIIGGVMEGEVSMGFLFGKEDEGEENE